MRKTLKSALLGAVACSTALGMLPPEAFAAPMTVTPRETISLSAPTSDVHYRRYYRGYYRPYGYYPRYRYGYYPRYRYGYDPAGAMFAGAALGLMGAGIAAATAPRWGYGGWGPWGYGGWGYGGFGPWGYGGWGGPFFW